MMFNSILHTHNVFATHGERQESGKLYAPLRHKYKVTAVPVRLYGRVHYDDAVVELAHRYALSDTIGDIFMVIYIFISFTTHYVSEGNKHVHVYVYAYLSSK